MLARSKPLIEQSALPCNPFQFDFLSMKMSSARRASVTCHSAQRDERTGDWANEMRGRHL